MCWGSPPTKQALTCRPNMRPGRPPRKGELFLCIMPRTNPMPTLFCMAYGVMGSSWLLAALGMNRCSSLRAIERHAIHHRSPLRLRRLAQDPVALDQHRPGARTEAEGQAEPPRVLAHTALNHAVDDSPPHFCPELVYRQTESCGEVACLDRDIVTVDLDDRREWIHWDAPAPRTNPAGSACITRPVTSRSY